MLQMFDKYAERYRRVSSDVSREQARSQEGQSDRTKRLKAQALNIESKMEVLSSKYDTIMVRMDTVAATSTKVWHLI